MEGRLNREKNKEPGSIVSKKHSVRENLGPVIELEAKLRAPYPQAFQWEPQGWLLINVNKAGQRETWQR